VNEILSTRGLCKSFGGIVVADNVTLSIGAGEIIGLIGPNGAGKTSLFNLISGVLSADAGEIYLCGNAIGNFSVHRRARAGIARTWQHVRLFKTMTVLENLLVAPREYSGESVTKVLFGGMAFRREQAVLRERANAILSRMGLAAAADRLVTELPFGQQKLVGVARALMNDGPCLLLDEPMAGVEGTAYEIMKTIVREEAAAGRAVCVVEHNISFIKNLCGSAVFMANGRIMQTGTVAELFGNKLLTQLYFGA
jgi:ABC-type branched-subunit amino acid transport system ATPase component